MASKDHRTSQMTELSAEQIGVLHHALGLSQKCSTPYRNHYVAHDKHHAWADLLALEALGLMAAVRTPKFCDPDDVVFSVTRWGEVVALGYLALLKRMVAVAADESGEA